MKFVTIIRARIVSKLRSRFFELYTKLPAFAELTRVNKPIGIYLLLWPTISALWIAEEGFPRFSLLFIFVAGTALMRSAGCCVNDFADHKIDGKVARTQRRPLATGSLTRKDAFLCFAALSLISFGLVLITNERTIVLVICRRCTCRDIPVHETIHTLAPVSSRNRLLLGNIDGFLRINRRCSSACLSLIRSKLFVDCCLRYTVFDGR